MPYNFFRLPFKTSGAKDKVFAKQYYGATDDILHTNDAEVYTNSITPVKLKEIRVNMSILPESTLRIKFSLKRVSTPVCLAYGYIYVNGVYYEGTEESQTFLTYTTYTHDITNIHLNDLIQIYGKIADDDAECYIMNFRILGSKSAFENITV